MDGVVQLRSDRGLPDRNALKTHRRHGPGDDDLDAADQPAFTIFKEQRIEVPLAEVSPNLIKAVDRRSRISASTSTAAST